MPCLKFCLLAHGPGMQNVHFLFAAIRRSPRLVFHKRGSWSLLLSFKGEWRKSWEVNVEYMMLIYLNCGVKYKVYPDHSSYERWSSESKAWTRFKPSVSWWRRDWLFPTQLNSISVAIMQSMAIQHHSFSSKIWWSQLWTQFKQLRIEAWKSQGFNWVWIRDLAMPVRRSNQLSYEATDVES